MLRRIDRNQGCDQYSIPKTEQQRCIVHMVRNTLKYVANKDKKAFAKDLKTIYTAANEESALARLEAVTENLRF